MIPRTLDHEFWRTYLAENPTVMYKLLADLHGTAAQFKGEAPGHLPTLEGLRELVTQQYSNDPFPVALKHVLGKRSARWLAKEMSMHFSYVYRLMNGEREVVDINDPRHSMERIEAFARVLRVHPAYFSEWRRLWIMSLLDQMFEEKPNLSIGVWRKFSEAASS